MRTKVRPARSKHISLFALLASLLLVASAVSAQSPSTDSNQSASDLSKTVGKCGTSVAAPSPTPQGTQQIYVCNNFSANAGANIELFNTTGQSCTISAGTTTWPFVQSAPFTIADGTGQWVTVLTTLTNGGTYNYTVSCCPPTPAATKTVTVTG